MLKQHRYPRNHEGRAMHNEPKYSCFRYNTHILWFLQNQKSTGEEMTRIEPAQVKYPKRLKAVQGCLCYYQNLLNERRSFNTKGTFCSYRRN